MEDQLILKLKNAPSFTIQLDETTDVSSQAQLDVFCRFANSTREKIAEHYLFCKPLGVDATANSIFGKLNDYIQEKGLIWENCKSVTTDGVAAMTGSIKSVVQKTKEVSPERISVRCILHSEALVAKKIGGSGENDTTFALLFQEVFGINYIRSNAKKRRIFTNLCEQMDASFTELLLHTKVRWLSRGRVLSRIFLLREELEVFFTNEQDHRASKFYKNI